MMAYLWRRTLWSLSTLFGISVVAFLLISFAPGDPIAAELRSMGITAKPDTIERLRREFGLNAPLPERYLRWLGRALQLDFGRSISTGRPVVDELRRALGPTALLTTQAFGLIVALSVGFGFLASRFENPGIGFALHAGTILVVSVPLYWLALLVLTWAEAASWVAALLLSLAPSLAMSRVLKQRIDAERMEDYVRFAVSTGASPSEVLRREIVRPVLPLLFALWGNSLGYLLGGSIVFERIFGIAGLGSLAVQSIAARDYPVLQSYLLLAGTSFLASNWLADILSAWADPRLRYRGFHA
jgi:ABC-type dipeptide/oligopeptide/nickel transport system permease component